MRLLVLALLLISCGDLSPSHMPDRYYDPALKPILDSFMAEAKAYGHGDGHLDRLQRLVLVDFDDLNTPSTMLMGLCSTFEEKTDDGRRYVWDVVQVITGLDPCVERYVTYHELAHCVYGAPHYPNPGHMMYHEIEVEAEDCPVVWEERVKTAMEGL